MTRCARATVLSHPACDGRSLRYTLLGYSPSSACVSFLFSRYLSTHPPSLCLSLFCFSILAQYCTSEPQLPSPLPNLSPGRGGPMVLLLILTDAGLSAL